ncbi:MAG TPA: aspartate aminotransferase family protein, partial [Bacteroidota bacterium]|nr:aspartate aminotransferase family protein [Bacteroidota bacterium]
MDHTSLVELLTHTATEISRWESALPLFTPDESLSVSDADARAALTQLTDRLRENYPFFHPRYAGQMLKPPHPIAVAAYATAMLINPNNHALDGGPATARMELDAVGQIARMFGYDRHLGHLTSGGTMANIEALWVARSLQPGKAVAFSSAAHYTHKRMCGVLEIPFREIPVNTAGK